MLNWLRTILFHQVSTVLAALGVLKTANNEYFQDADGKFFDVVE